MMVNQEETIKSLQGEILRLKVACNNYEKMLNTAGIAPAKDLDETKRDLIADLMEANDELKNQLNIRSLEGEQIREKPQMVEIACQTSLDRLGIDRLIEESLTLKKERRNYSEMTEQLQQMKQKVLCLKTTIHHKQHQQQQQQSLTHQHLTSNAPQYQQNQHQNQEHYTRQPYQHQMHIYQQVHPPSQEQTTQRQPPPPNRNYQTVYSSNNLTIDENEMLDKMVRLDGLLTTARDKLRIKTLN